MSNLTLYLEFKVIYGTYDTNNFVMTNKVVDCGFVFFKTPFACIEAFTFLAL